MAPLHSLTTHPPMSSALNPQWESPRVLLLAAEVATAMTEEMCALEMRGFDDFNRHGVIVGIGISCG